jgi:hypothetical protein
MCLPSSQPYSAGSPIPITVTNTTLTAISCGPEGPYAGSVRATYTLTAAVATFAPPSGAANPTSVTLTTATRSGVIHYTTDGTTATCVSPGTVATNGTLSAGQYPTGTFTMSAIVCKVGYASSPVAAATYH